jgi:hypothetical protein
MTKQDIVPIPQIPPQLIEAINNNQFAIFFGAGTSMLIGCGSWETLAKNLVEQCFTTPKKEKSSITCINFKEREALLRMQDPKKIITICQYVLHNNDSDGLFFKEIEGSLQPSENLLKTQDIYTELQGLHGLFITTNIDRHFDRQFNPSQLVYRKEDFDHDDIDDSKLYHIHGSILDWESIVLTVKQYLDRYNDPQFRAFLMKIFETKTILFIGYGLSEFEVLDFLIIKSKASLSNEPKHYILMPYYAGEDTLLEFERHYFSQMDVSVIAYRKDEKGYGQLFDIIKKWNRDILLQSRFLHDKFENLKDAANNYTPEVEGRIFQSIKNDRVLEVEFFKQLSMSNDPIPWLEPLKKFGYFDPKNNPSVKEGRILYWNVMGAFENIARVNSNEPCEETTDEIFTIVNAIIEYKGANDRRTENILTDRHIVRIIFLLPLIKVTDHHFDFIRNVLKIYPDRILIAGEFGESIIPRLLKSENLGLLLKSLDIILDFEKSKSPTFEEYPSILGEHYLEVVLEKYSDKIISLCGIAAIDVALQKIKQIVTEDPDQFNTIWLPTLKENGEFKERYDHQIIYLIIKAFKQLGPETTREKILELLSKNHPIFKRIAITIIDNYYGQLKELFWEYKGNPLAEYQISHEVYDFFNNHCTEFSDSEINKIIDWIESPIYHAEQLEKSAKESYLAYYKKEWLSSLLKANNPKVQTLYEQYNSINPSEIKHPGQGIVIEHFSGTTSPILVEELSKKSNPEIVEYLNNYKNENFGESIIFTHSLCDVFRTCVIDNPQKFIDDLTPFLHAKRLLQYELFLGLTEAWRKGKQYNWAKIIEFINSLIDPEEFWTESYLDGKENYRNWIIPRIAELIEEGTRNDSHLLELKLLPDVEKILIILAKKAESDLNPTGDLINSVMNSNKGSIYSTMVNYSLCFARHYRKNESVRWPDAIKTEFEVRLNPLTEPTVEFSVTLGKYLPYLCSIDREWVKKNINKIFPQDNEIHWTAAFTSYLFYAKIYPKIYFLLKENGNYLKAINTDFKEPRINEQLMHHICLGYLENFESLNDGKSLIVQVFNRWNSKQITELIRFLRWYCQNNAQEKRSMVIPLWRTIMATISKDTENMENPPILAELNSWLSLVDELSEEICNWLKLSIKHISSHEFGFIEQLIRHANSKPKCCGEIFIIMVESGHYFEYQKEDIIKLVSILYEKNEKTNADVICNLYLQVGFDFLNSIYEKHIPL